MGRLAELLESLESSLKLPEQARATGHIAPAAPIPISGTAPQSPPPFGSAIPITKGTGDPGTRGGGALSASSAIVFSDQADAAELLQRNRITLCYVQTDDVAQQAVQALVDADAMIGFDIETAKLDGHASDARAGLDPKLSRIRLAQCYAGGTTVYVFDIDAVGLAPLSPLWIRPLVVHNAVFELKHLLHAGVFADAMDCTLLQANALEGGILSLVELAKKHLGWTLSKELQTSDWNSPVLVRAQLAYAAVDAVAVHRIATLRFSELTARNRIRPYRLMKSAQRAIAELELNGLYVDREAHANATETWEKRLQDRGLALSQFLGPEINPSSSHQLAEWFRQNMTAATLKRWPKTPTGKLKTDADTLRRLSDHPLIAPLLAHKDAQKRVSTYGKNFAEHFHPVTGRIHAHFKLGGTATGRLSCSGPNVQNVPRDPEFRALFSTPPGRVLVVADYSQMELRVAALVSQDPTMLDVFARGDDLHRKTAAAIAGVPFESVTVEQRRIAKAVNFGLLYGMGAEGLGRYAATNYGVTMSEKEAQNARDKFLATYPGIALWQRKAAATAQRCQRVVTPAGRVRDFRHEKTGYRYTEALNTPIQGGAAEVVLAALARLPDLLAGLDARLVNVIHDEIVLEVSERDAPEAKVRLERAMVAGMREIFPDAPTNGLVEARIAANWADGK